MVTLLDSASLKLETNVAHRTQITKHMEQYGKFELLEM